MDNTWFSGIHLLAMVGVITFGLMAIGRAADLVLPFYRKQIDKEAMGDRFHSIDGMRGFLAIGVMFHHCVINYYLFQTGKWDAPPSHLALMFGQVGVGFFFMVTAFLFCHRALIREGNIDIPSFFWSRIMRMCPMYFTAALLLVFTAFLMTGFRLNVPLWELAKEITGWLAFTAFGAPAVNALTNTGLINTVFWSLIFEWRFYLAFPVLVIFARGRLPWLAWFVCLILVSMFTQANYEWYFLAGALAAILSVQFPQIKKVCRSHIASVVAIAMLILGIKASFTAYDPKVAAPLFVTFLIVANGNTLLGILTLRPVRVLGLISYSVYLLHNWVISTGSWMLGHYWGVDMKALEPLHYWGITACFAVVTVALALTTYRMVEFPLLKVKMPSRAPLTGDARSIAATVTR